MSKSNQNPSTLLVPGASHTNESLQFWSEAIEANGRHVLHSPDYEPGDNLVERSVNLARIILETNPDTVEAHSMGGAVAPATLIALAALEQDLSVETLVTHSAAAPEGSTVINLKRTLKNPIVAMKRIVMGTFWNSAINKPLARSVLFNGETGSRVDVILSSLGDENINAIMEVSKGFKAFLPEITEAIAKNLFVEDDVLSRAQSRIHSVLQNLENGISIPAELLPERIFVFGSRDDRLQYPEDVIKAGRNLGVTAVIIDHANHESILYDKTMMQQVFELTDD